jgi:transposase
MVDLVQHCRDLEARLKVVLEENAALKVQVRELMATIQRLEARLRLNSQNSSQPPSQDGPRRPLKREKKRSGRRPGGQPGHPGKTRDRLPPERVDQVQDCDPTACARCGDALQDRPRLEGFIRQVIEAPVVRALVSEFHLWKKRCARCGGFTWGQLPPGTPAGAFGPRLQALIALLTGMFELSRRDVVEVLRTVLDVDLCLGSVQGCCEAVSAAVAPTVQEVHADLKASPIVHADETSFGFLDGHHRWLWILASGASEAFLLQEGRGQQEAIALLGPGFKGVLIRDRWRPYEVFDGFGKASSQLCHAHLRREFKALTEADGVTQAMGKVLLEASDCMFHDWHRFMKGELSRREFQKNMEPIQEAFLDAFEQALGNPGYSREAVNLATDLMRQWDWLWTFVFVDAVDPTNNRAESGIRRAVIWEKTSFGAHSDAGCRFVERILTIVGTARRRGIAVLDWLTRAVQAHLDGRRAPPFVPAQPAAA